MALPEDGFPFQHAMRHSACVHLHVKVDDANDSSLNQACGSLGQLEYRKDGFVKYQFPGNVNLIFSSIPVSEDELLETECNLRPRPFLDHIGIDLREESDEVKKSFDAIPERAQQLGWPVVTQGADGQGVHCCHVQVNAKHWVFPGESTPAPQIPLEFAFGQLKLNDLSGGCDLRPMNPTRKARDGIRIPICHE